MQRHRGRVWKSKVCPRDFKCGRGGSGQGQMKLRPWAETSKQGDCQVRAGRGSPNTPLSITHETPWDPAPHPHRPERETLLSAWH